jgi:ketosteroid isomerase-like protein
MTRSLGFALLLLAGCRAAPAERAPAADAAGPPLTAEDIAAIRAGDSAFASAAGAGEAASMAQGYLSDANLLPPNSPAVEGREAIQRFWAGLLDTYKVKFVVSADEIEGRGDLAYARGHYLFDATPKATGGAPLHDEGKYVEVLRRQPDGTWRLAVDIYNSSLPPSAK